MDNPTRAHLTNGIDSFNLPAAIFFVYFMLSNEKLYCIFTR